MTWGKKLSHKIFFSFSMHARICRPFFILKNLIIRMGKYLDSFDIIFLSFSSKATKQDDARGFIRFKKHRGKVGFH